MLSFRAGPSKNKNIDHQVKETCAQVTYKTNHISVLRHSIMSSELFFKHTIFVFYVFSCDLKDKYHIRRNKICKKRKVGM